MALFENLGKRISDFSQDVANQSKNMMDNADANKSIAQEEKKIERFYRDLGQQYYERTRADGQTPEADAFLFASIDASKEKILEYQKQIAANKGYQLCPECQSKLDLDAKFCKYCGTKL